MMTKQTGFTIIELMLTIAIAGILMAVALPNYSNMTKNNCLTTSVNSLVATLQRARSEAIKARTDVTITAAGGNWGSGWSVTMDEDRDDDDVLDTGEDFDGDGVLDSSVTIQTATLTCGATITEVSDPVKTSLAYGSPGFVNLNT